MVSPWRRKNCGRKITKPKIRVLMVISTQQPTIRRCSSGGFSMSAAVTWATGGGNTPGGRGRPAGGFLFDRLHHGFGLRRAALRFKPARRFRKVLAQIPDDQ